jgi:hypothetical protein
MIKKFVAEMWSHQIEPDGEGLPKAVRVWSRIEDIPDRRPTNSANLERCNSECVRETKPARFCCKLAPIMSLMSSERYIVIRREAGPPARW